MQTSLLFFFVSYFLVVFVALLWVFWQDTRFFWLAGINFLSLLIFFVLSYFFKKQENLGKSISDDKDEKPRYSHQFVKYPYMKHENKAKKASWYLLFFSTFFFLFSVLDLTIFHLLWQFVWVFPILYLVLLFVSGKDLIENKIKIFWFSFDFYFFLFVSSLVVGVLVYGTLIFDVFPLLLLSASLVSFLFFFVGYVFIKSQWIRYFFRLIYAKLYFVAIFFLLLWSLIVVPSKHSLGSFFGTLSQETSTLFLNLFEKENKDPLLYTGEGVVVGSWLEIDVVETGIIEETGMVVSSKVNDVFVANDTGVLVQETEILEQQVDPSTAIKQKLSITDTSSISIIDALVYLMDMNGTILSSQQNVKFRYVTTKNPFYNYYITAYQKKIIGAATNPSTKITCETYQVFKGMIEWWDLTYSPATVKSVFRAEAKKRDVLNGCVYGKLVKGENL